MNTSPTYTVGQRITARVEGREGTYTGTILYVGMDGYNVKLDGRDFPGFWIYEREITGLAPIGLVGDDELLTAAAVGLADEAQP